MKFGFGIVGCGMIAAFHARAIQELRNARLIACFSRQAENAARFAALQHCDVHPSIQKLVCDPRIHVVCVCTPSGAHAEAAVAAAVAGKHVIIEKPLEVTLARCDRILHAAERAGVVVSTVFQSRFHEAPRAVYRAIQQARFGQVALANAYVKWYRSQEYYDSGAWRGTWKLDGGGALMNQAIHTVDLLLWLMGPVRSVTAQSAIRAHDRIEVEDTLVATLEFANGALGTIEATTASWPGSLKRIEIHGSGGTAVLEEEQLVVWNFRRPHRADAKVLAHAKTTTEGGASDPAAIGHHGHLAQFRNVLQAIEKGMSPLIDGPQSRASVQLVLAIYQAAKSGRRVQMA